jgi:hypothetical protein
LLIRFLPAILFAVAWLPLNRWYAYQRPFDFILFALAFVPACVIALLPAFRWIQVVSIPRKFIALFLLLLALPWGEWLQLNFSFSRMDWSRQIYFHAFILYLFSIVYAISNRFWGVLHKRFVHFLENVSVKPFIVLIPSFFFFVFASWITLFVYGGTVPVADSAAHIFQAKIFAAGKLFAPAPPVTDFFSVRGDMLVLENGKWFAMYLPGFAAMLAAAMKIHAQWILCPLLGSLSIAIWILYVLRWHDKPTAIVFSLLCVLSPFLFLMSSMIMIHTPELLVVSAAVYLLRAETESSLIGNKILIFIVLLIGVIVRGFSILAFLTPLLLYSFFFVKKKKRFTLFLVLAGSILAGATLVAFFQWNTSGNPFLPGYSLEYQVPHSYGFGKSVANQVHTPLRGLENISNDLLGLNHWLNGWYCGSYVFLICFILFCRWNIWDRLLLIGCLCVLSFYYFYLFQDLVIGPRFLYPLAPVALLFVARAILIPATSELPIPPFPFFLFLFAVVSFIPFRLPGFVMKYEPSKSQAGALRKEIEARGNTPTIAFLEGNVTHQLVNWNDPFLRDPVIILKDLGSKNMEAIKAFADRKPVYFGLQMELERNTKDYGFKFRNKRSQPTSGAISLMQVAFAMSTSIEYPDQDFFDHAFQILLDGTPAEAQKVFLEQQLKAGKIKSTPKSFFRMGLIYSTNAMLLLKQSYLQYGDNWAANFRYEDFRKMIANAFECFNNAAEPGKQLIQSLNKVKRRIDRNDDEFMSDLEIERFLKPKVKILETSNW